MVHRNQVMGVLVAVGFHNPIKSDLVVGERFLYE
jgi:hypothetical protein